MKFLLLLLLFPLNSFADMMVYNCEYTHSFNRDQSDNLQEQIIKTKYIVDGNKAYSVSGELTANLSPYSIEGGGVRLSRSSNNFTEIITISNKYKIVESTHIALDDGTILSSHSYGTCFDAR